MSKCYIVAFEAALPGTAEKIKAHLKTFGTYCPINSNLWAVVTDQAATQIRDQLIALAQPQDKLFVVRSGTESAWRGVYSEKNSEWLKERL